MGAPKSYDGVSVSMSETADNLCSLTGAVWAVASAEDDLPEVGVRVRQRCPFTGDEIVSADQVMSASAGFKKAAAMTAG